MEDAEQPKPGLSGANTEALEEFERMVSTCPAVDIELRNGEIRAFGLSNTLMLVNGLLRYQYPEFTNEMLDDIEKFILGFACRCQIQRNISP